MRIAAFWMSGRNREKGTIGQWVGIALVFAFLCASLYLLGEIHHEPARR